MNTKCQAAADPIADGGYSFTLTSGDTTTHVNNDFGNFKLGTKAGMKFEDVDGNAAYDSTIDKPLGGWVIALIKENGKAAGLQMPGETNADGPVTGTSTGADGKYAFTGLTAGTYYVDERCPEGWVQTFPNTDKDLATCDYYTIAVTSGFSDTDSDFGNFKLGTKAGMKWEDTNGDGLKTLHPLFPRFRVHLSFRFATPFAAGADSPSQ